MTSLTFEGTGETYSIRVGQIFAGDSDDDGAVGSSYYGLRHGEFLLELEASASGILLFYGAHWVIKRGAK